jgi:UDP-2,4-diacetamido-2,4,6-trideoxy-beta-L-altropyranose hydrolase
MTTPILIAADAGPVAGLGHLQRCLALADALRDTGAEPLFVTSPDAAQVRTRVSAAGFPTAVTSESPWTADAMVGLRELARQKGAPLVVLDADGDRLTHLPVACEGPVPVCVIDDNGDRPIAASAVLNGNVHAKTLRYDAIPEGRSLLGPAFMLLPRSYWTATAPPMQVPPRRALITLGGGDPIGLWPMLLDALCAVPTTWSMTAVVGPFVADTDELRAAISRFELRGVVRRALQSLADEVAAVDVALTAAGQTLYELAAMGRPAVAIQMAVNQGPQLAAFEGLGTVVSVEGCDLAERAVRTLIDLAADSIRLQAMAEAGPRVVDGRGARRVADALAAWFPGSR